MKVDLSTYQNREFSRGRSFIIELLWQILSKLFVESTFSCNFLRVRVLRLFGAKIEARVVIKPGVKVKFPWKLSVGRNSWIGERAWLDNLAFIQIGDNCCISQEAYLCTGNHDWNTTDFRLRTSGIQIQSCSWVGARAIIAPGAFLKEGTVVAAGAVFGGISTPWSIFQGNPAKWYKNRQIV